MAGSLDLADLFQERRAILEQAAKEVGGVFTNVSRTENASIVATMPATIEERRNMLADRLGEALRKGLLAPASG